MQNNLLPKIFSNIVIHKKPHPFHETNNFNILALYVLKLRKMFDVILIKTLSWRDCVLKKKYLHAFISSYGLHELFCISTYKRSWTFHNLTEIVIRFQHVELYICSLFKILIDCVIVPSDELVPKKSSTEWMWMNYSHYST